ncbi:lysylphosphatidylglycerol synthase transmembrane domain-containing protein [Iodobacter ciconiae]|uniref:Flippase-like domain-containing protein n=1 Tax=Iodobacter ciconiae TaxID=2496266 RepID=A0A3S8ZVS7_9NEIS|nr:lysylphosphatidylglycerol synthase transmembrane domain-containing protein [Iodobacter ciconiae]AZN37566.1 flippase-like domain-containing protein [Iodobacter ciconiae]
MKRHIRTVIGLIIAIILTGLIFRKTDGTQLIAAIKSSNPLWLLAGLIIFSLGLIGRAARWSSMLRTSSPNATPRACLQPFLSSLALNNVLPFRAGDLARVFVFNKTLGTGPGQILASLFVERLLDLASLLLFLALGLWAFDIHNLPTLGKVGASGTALIALLIFVLLAFPRWLQICIDGGLRLIHRLTPNRGHHLADEAADAIKLLSALGGKRILPLITISLIVWGLEGITLWCVAQSMPGLINSAGAWFALPLATLATLIPSTPGYVGTFDYFAILAMTLTQNDTVPATAFALIAHLLIWLPPTLAGGIWLLITRNKT